MKPHIRWMIRRDMPEVLAIEQECFGEIGWTEEDFLRMLRQRTMIGMVAEVSNQCHDFIRGFMVYDLKKGRLELLNMAVQKCCQHEGIGMAMVDKLKRKLSTQRRREITMHVPERNLDALLFFRSQGFLATGIAKGYYEDGGEDAITMAYCCPEMVEA